MYRGHHKAAVLSLCIPERDQLISSCYDKHVRVMDLRTPVSVQYSHQQHSKPVLCVAASSGVIYSGSEDKSLCVWDLRAQRLLQKLQVCDTVLVERVVDLNLPCLQVLTQWYMSFNK